MTAPPSAPGTRAPHWIFRPAVALPAIAALIVLVALLTPEDVTGRRGDARLTTRSAQPLGASALFELAQRLGWRTTRRLQPVPPPNDSQTIQAVLDPPDAPSAIETHALLDAVRRGGALLVVFGSRGPIADSLHVRLGDGYPYQPRLGADSIDAGRCPRDASPGLPLWLGQRPMLNAVRFTQPPPRDTVVFATVTPRASTARTEPAAVGFPLGRGRIVAIGDPDLLRNDVLRVCDWNADVVAVRMLEYLSAGDGFRRSRVAFDEYHQGYGAHPGTVRGITVYLGRTPSGHVLFQLALAGVVLLLAIGPRALPPRDESRVERRSPLEHVDALARAYAQVGATRTATARLLHGVRRRLRRTGRGALGQPDSAFLDAARHKTPALEPDVALIRHALAAPVSKRELEAVGAALARLESSLTTLPP